MQADNANFTGGGHTFGNNSTVNNTNIYGGAHALENLKEFVSFAALHDSAEQDPDRCCHPGTRKSVLSQLRHWIDNPNPTDRIFWLHGPAGAGKSAIAQTIAREYNKGGVAATFFFYRSDPGRNDGNRLFTTIAWQLAFSIPAVKDFIIAALEKTPHLPMKAMETQFEELVAHPTNNIASQMSQLAPVVIIDGVDECYDEPLQRRFLAAIGNAVKDRRVPLRFLICSRNEALIEETLDQFKDFTLRVDLATLDDANRDIERYLTDKFSVIASKQHLDPSWPGQEIIEEIVFKSSGNFILASTLMRFIGDEDHSAVAQLDIVRKLKPQPEGTVSPFALLDELYLKFLEWQPESNQEFLKTFLALMMGRSSIKWGVFYNGVFHNSVFHDNAFNQSKFHNSAFHNSVFHDNAFNQSEFHNSTVDNSAFHDFAFNQSEFHNSAVDNSAFHDFAFNQSEFHNSAVDNSAFHDFAFNQNKFHNSAVNNSAFHDHAFNQNKFHNSAVNNNVSNNVAFNQSVFHNSAVNNNVSNNNAFNQSVFHNNASNNNESNNNEYNNNASNNNESNHSVSNQSVSNQSVSNPSVSNQSVSNQSVSNPSVSNQSVSNQSMSNQSVSNQSMSNQSVSNQSMSNHSVSNHRVSNQSESNHSMSNRSEFHNSNSEFHDGGLHNGDNGKLHKDDAKLMNVSEEELHIKLRKMRSLLKFEPFIDIHHKSFLDFLQDSSRSGRYHISKQSGQKRYLELIVDSVVQHVSMVIKQPNRHKICRSSLEFKYIIGKYPPAIDLSVKDWEEALKPLLDLQDELLNTSKLVPCRVTQTMRDLLLTLRILQSKADPIAPAQAPKSNIKETVTKWIRVLVTKARNIKAKKNLDSCLSLLLSLQKSSPMMVDTATITCMFSLLAFHSETARRVRSVSDAQKLIDLVELLVNDRSFLNKCGPDAARKAAHLASEIFARVPLLPRSFWNGPLRLYNSNVEVSLCILCA
ncbi:hypothetical protein JOM56_013012 [Amanita muscaria]